MSLYSVNVIVSKLKQQPKHQVVVIPIAAQGLLYKALLNANYECMLYNPHFVMKVT